MHEFQQQQNSLAQVERTSISAQNGPAWDPSTGIDPARRYPPLHERTGSTYVQVSILVQAHGNLPARVGINPCARGDPPPCALGSMRTWASTPHPLHVDPHLRMRGHPTVHAQKSTLTCIGIHLHPDPPAHKDICACGIIYTHRERCLAQQSTRPCVCLQVRA